MPGGFAPYLPYCSLHALHYAAMNAYSASTFVREARANAPNGAVHAGARGSTPAALMSSSVGHAHASGAPTAAAAAGESRSGRLGAFFVR